MRFISLPMLLFVSSTLCFAAGAETRSCHVQVNMSSGSLPQDIKLQVFAADKRIAELPVLLTGSVILPPLAPGEYRLQTGEGTNFMTSGPLHVPESGACEYTINILGHADSKSKLVEDDLDVEDLRVPRKARERFEQGFATLQQGNLEEARKDFLEVIRLDPKLSRAYNVLGVISDQQMDRAGARQYFEKALELNPRSKPALMNMAKLSMREKQYDTALGLLERFRVGARETADVHAMEADAYLKLAKYPEAIREAQAAHRLSHANWETVHLIAATAYEALHQPQMAAIEYQLYLDESSNPEMRAVASRRIRELGGVAQASPAPIPINSLMPPRDKFRENWLLRSWPSLPLVLGSGSVTACCHRSFWISQQGKIAFHNVQHKFAQCLGTGAAVKHLGFRFRDSRLCHCGNQRLNGVGCFLPGLALAFQQADEMPEALGIVPLDRHGAKKSGPLETKTASGGPIRELCPKFLLLASYSSGAKRPGGPRMASKIKLG